MVQFGGFLVFGPAASFFATRLTGTRIRSILGFSWEKQNAEYGSNLAA